MEIVLVGLFADEFTKFKMQDLFTGREYPVWQPEHTVPDPKLVVEIQAYGMQTNIVGFICQRNASLKQLVQPLIEERS